MSEYVWDGSSAIGCDSDLHDLSHEGYFFDLINGELKEKFDICFYDIYELYVWAGESEKLLKESNLDKKLVNTLLERKCLVAWGLENGYLVSRGTHIDCYDIKKSFNKIGDFVYDLFCDESDEDKDDRLIYVNDIKTSKNYVFTVHNLVNDIFEEAKKTESNTGTIFVGKTNWDGD